jgi:hypothetical protein
MPTSVVMFLLGSLIFICFTFLALGDGKGGGLALVWSFFGVGFGLRQSLGDLVRKDVSEVTGVGLWSTAVRCGVNGNQNQHDGS